MGVSARLSATLRSKCEQPPPIPLSCPRWCREAEEHSEGISGISATDMIRDMYEKFDEALGGLVYQQFSLVAHGTMVGIMPSFDIPDQPDEDGNRRGPVT